MLQSPEQIIIIIVIIITYSVWRQFHSLFRSKFSRQRNIMLPLRKQEKSPEKWCLYRIRPSFLICSPVQSPPRNRKFNGPTPGYSLNTVKAPDGPGNRPFQTKRTKIMLFNAPTWSDLSRHLPRASKYYRSCFVCCHLSAVHPQ